MSELRIFKNFRKKLKFLVLIMMGCIFYIFGSIPGEGEIAEINDWGSNSGLRVERGRQREVNASEIKVILAWNEAYGSKRYDIGFGREAFYRYKCPETRCLLTDDRGYKKVEDFDAIIFHQRSFDWGDIPIKRDPRQRYIHWNIESAQYVFMSMADLNGFFNWTMTYRRDSDFYLPYGRLHKIKEHPTDSKELSALIKDFGKRHAYLARGLNKKPRAAWFVSHCATQARREVYARTMNRSYPVDIYGKCGKLKCSRKDEKSCYEMLEENYKYYLSFENSICEDYVTEKYFNVLKYNVIPITLSGANFSAISPLHSSLNVMDSKSSAYLIRRLKTLDLDDAKYAEYFWWKEYYEIRNRGEDRAQAYCNLCHALWHDSKPKVYENFEEWWIRKSRCRKLTTRIPKP